MLLVGDAAGHVDPLTGEGIHTAMIAGKIAAQICQEMFTTSNFSLQAGEAYSLRCYDAFGYEFWSSSLCARIIHAMPIAIDAVAVVGARRGQAFLDFFGYVIYVIYVLNVIYVIYLRVCYLSMLSPFMLSPYTSR